MEVFQGCYAVDERIQWTSKNSLQSGFVTFIFSSIGLAFFIFQLKILSLRSFFKMIELSFFD